MIIIGLSVKKMDKAKQSLSYPALVVGVSERGTQLADPRVVFYYVYTVSRSHMGQFYVSISWLPVSHSVRSKYSESTA